MLAGAWRRGGRRGEAERGSGTRGGVGIWGSRPWQIQSAPGQGGDTGRRRQTSGSPEAQAGRTGSACPRDAVAGCHRPHLGTTSAFYLLLRGMTMGQVLHSPLLSFISHWDCSGRFWGMSWRQRASKSPLHPLQGNATETQNSSHFNEQGPLSPRPSRQQLCHQPVGTNTGEEHTGRPRGIISPSGNAGPNRGRGLPPFRLHARFSGGEACTRAGSRRGGAGKQRARTSPTGRKKF